MESGIIEFLGKAEALYGSGAVIVGLLCTLIYRRLSEERKAQVKAALKFWKKLRGGK